MSVPVIEGPDFRLRAPEPRDAGSIARLANNRAIWRNLTDRFPHPYEIGHARSWIAERTRSSESAFVVEVDGEAVGTVGVNPYEAEGRHIGEIGYWLGEPFWGRGLASAAVGLASDFAFETLGLLRLQAHVFEWNTGSARVLEKNGFTLEARIRQGAFKDDELIDVLFFGRLRDAAAPGRD